MFKGSAEIARLKDVEKRLNEILSVLESEGEDFTEYNRGVASNMTCELIRLVRIRIYQAQTEEDE
jgi:hypothetical protein